MEQDFETELKGTLNQAINAQQQILKYFKRCGESGHQEANKHQLVFACKISSVITKCKEKHLDIYFHIITQIFGDQLKPESNLKYWTLYVNCIRYIHYSLVIKKEYEKASAMYKYISSFDTKLQSADIGNTILSIYCSQFLLQISLKSLDNKTALSNANEIIENLTKLFEEFLDTNKQLNFQYPDILKTAFQCLFSRNSMIGAVFKFMNLLSAVKVKKMFVSLFTIYSQQTIQTLPSQEDIQSHAQFIIETLYLLMQIDIMDKFQLQLTQCILSHCRTEYRLQSYKPIAEILLTLNDYLQLLCTQKKDSVLPSVFNACCGRFKELFQKYSKSIMNQQWFGDLLVFLYYLHNQLQNIEIFPCFRQQMSEPDCYRAIFQLFTECIKLAPCISSETKLFSITCCSSIRKHVVFSFAQTAISFFAFYCQNVAPVKEEHLAKCNNNAADSYKETIHQPLIMILNHALKIINNMECITSNTQDINLLLTRFKYAALSAKTSRQAGTCLSICELFLNIKTKIPSHEWPLLLRRLYKVVTEYVISPPNLGREIQMCYIASMLDKSIAQIDIGQIRTQINIFYTVESTTQKNVQHESCLMQLYYMTTCSFRPHLEPSRKKLLHWLDSQYILKYIRNNTQLLHSLLKHSQSQYDFVIMTKEAKLETYALNKISSLCKALSSKAQEIDGLGRLEQLTYGHALTMLNREQLKSYKLQVCSKDLIEEDLDKLLLREEMSSITISDELKRIKIAMEAFKAFEQFYEKFDSETISMDDAIIDWECLMDDLASLADYLQLSGYLDYCAQVFLLLYKYSHLIQNYIYALKSLTFFCEYSEFYEANNTKTTLNIDKEIESNFNAITLALENLSAIQWSKQNIILLAVVQIAYYYARSNRYTFAQILLQYVEQRHFELPERQGAYDIVMATLDAIKFRLIWKRFENNNSDQKTILQRCLLFEMDETLERLHEFKYGNVRSTDAMKFSIFAVNLVLEFCECAANRLCDNFLTSFIHLIIKISLQMGLSLRLVQIMSRWMWINLQMEFVDKAQKKLKIIQYVMSAKSLKELTEKCNKTNVILTTPSKDLTWLNCNNNNMEEVRKLSQVQLSPVKTNKLQVSPASTKYELNRYFSCNIDTKLMPQNDLIEWTYFMVGCLNARLYFLAEDYDQLHTFYENGNKWLQKRQNLFNKQYYTNIQLLAMQHYINFLRSQRQYEKALDYLKLAIEMCDNMKFKIDVVYHLNFQTQLLATKIELEGPKSFQNHNKIRRALEFNLSPECNSEIHEKAKNELKEKMIENMMTSTKKGCKTSSLKTVVTGSATASSRKPKIQSSYSSSGSSSSLDTKFVKTKQKLKFDICEDSMEMIDSDECINELELPILEITNFDESINTLECVEDVKTAKRTKPIEINEQYKTTKLPKTATKTTATTEKIKKFKRTRVQQPIEIDLTDSPSPTQLQTSSSASSTTSLEQLETNVKLDLVQQMKNLEIEVVKKSTATGPKPKTRGRKPALAKQLSAPLIVLIDSPSISPSNSEVSDGKKSSRTRTKRDKTPVSKPTESRARRQRKLVLVNDENNDMPKSSLATLPSSSSSTVSSRRRQKI